jgi:hypothetical protein
MSTGGSFWMCFVFGVPSGDEKINLGLEPFDLDHQMRANNPT